MFNQSSSFLLCYVTLNLIGRSACEIVKLNLLQSFTPKRIRNFENIGSQENFFWTIPAKYSSDVRLLWNGHVGSSGSGIPTSCGTVDAEIVINKYGIPISNPLNTTVPKNTFSEFFYVTQQFVINDQNHTDFMNFSEPSSVDEEYYAAVYLTTPVKETNSLATNCEYFVSLNVFVNSEVIETPTVDFESTYITNETINLPRVEGSFLVTQFPTNFYGFNVTNDKNISMQWDIVQLADTGGTMYVELSVQSANITENVSLNSQVIWEQNGAQANFLLDIMPNSSKITTSDMWYWPYPKAGSWVMLLNLNCGENRCTEAVKVFVKIGIVACIQNCHSDGYQGKCKLYTTNAVNFASCDCQAGWAGIACTDGTNAMSYSEQLTHTLLLTLSNLIFLFCVVLAIKRKFYTEGAVYFFVAFFSSFYHACDEPGYVVLCIMDYNTLQYADFLGSNCAFWFTIIAIASLPYPLESLFHVAGVLCIAVGVEHNRFSIWVTLIAIMIGLAVLALKWGRNCYRKHSCYPKKRVWLLSLIPGVFTAGVGLVLYGFLETDDNYFYVHSIWHILMGVSILFLLPFKKVKHRNNNIWHTNSSANSSETSFSEEFAELLPVPDCTHSTNKQRNKKKRNPKRKIVAM